MQKLASDEDSSSISGLTDSEGNRFAKILYLRATIRYVMDEHRLHAIFDFNFIFMQDNQAK